MKNFFTDGLSKTLLPIASFSILFLISACSASEGNLDSTDKNSETITIQNDEGETVLRIQNDQVVSIEKNGIELSEMEKNIYLEHLKSKPGFFTSKDVHSKFDFNDNDLSIEYLTEDSLSNKILFNLNFNDEEFQKQMMQLKKQFACIDIPNFKFDIDEDLFKTQMKELEDNLQNIKIEIPEIHIDFQEDDIKIELRELMQQLDEEMENLDLNMEELNSELKKLNEFISEIKSEMLKDGLLNSEDEEIQVNFNIDEIKINGRILSENLEKKYKAIYKKHFNKNLEEDFNLHFNE